MKKLLLSVFMIGTLAASAQNNIIKWNVLALSLSNVSLQYEHSLNEHSSLALGISFLPSRGLPSAAIKSGDGDNSDELSLLSFSGFAITPEYRYYFSGNGPTGFYAAPYFRYSKYSFEKVGITYQPGAGGVDETIFMDGDFKNTVVGLMFGAQWALGDHFALDWWIIGAGFGSQKGTFTAKGNFDQSDIDEIKGDLNDTDGSIPGDLDYTVSSSKVEVEYKAGFPAFRGFGLCIGYRF